MKLSKLIFLDYHINDTLAKNDKNEDNNDDDYLVEIKTLSSNEDENSVK